ncbi:oxygenase MpaB family protein [Actinocorallia sp. B10E7]|uniref:oxygenase MpaB family protein n=1 Tax=Actinocorallia sp. B10E7 TaxID=3153558 RepID=UPI00325CC93A
MSLTEESGLPETTTRTSAVEPVPFGPGSYLWEHMGLYTSAFAGNCAFILQAMHPTVSVVSDQYSAFRTDPVGRAVRSFASVQTWVYGGEAAIEEGKRLREMHKPLVSFDEEGRRHHALSADAWAWVHVTGLYGTLMAARYFAPAPPTRAEEQRIFDEFMNLGRILRVPERMLPETLEDFWTSFDKTVDDTLEATKVALEVVDMMDKTPVAGPAALRPALARIGMATGRVGRFVTAGTLPPAAREKLGLTWTAADERRLRALGQAVARTSPLLPERVRYMPIAYRARVAARARQSLDHALATRPL